MISAVFEIFSFGFQLKLSVFKMVIGVFQIAFRFRAIPREPQFVVISFSYLGKFTDPISSSPEGGGNRGSIKLQVTNSDIAVIFIWSCCWIYYIGCHLELHACLVQKYPLRFNRFDGVFLFLCHTPALFANTFL